MKKNRIYKNYECEDDVYYFDDRQYTLDRDDESFSVGQHDDELAARTVVCRGCGGKDFNVGKARCYTAIKCILCGWEQCVHEG